MGPVAPSTPEQVWLDRLPAQVFALPLLTQPSQTRSPWRRSLLSWQLTPVGEGLGAQWWTWLKLGLRRKRTLLSACPLSDKGPYSQGASLEWLSMLLVLSYMLSAGKCCNSRKASTLGAFHI